VTVRFRDAGATNPGAAAPIQKPAALASDAATVSDVEAGLTLQRFQVPYSKAVLPLHITSFCF
jgi:hypothetical protein